MLVRCGPYRGHIAPTLEWGDQDGRGLSAVASHCPCRPGITTNITGVPTAIVRVPSAMAVQWKNSSSPDSSSRTVPNPLASSNATTAPLRYGSAAIDVSEQYSPEGAR